MKRERSGCATPAPGRGWRSGVCLAWLVLAGSSSLGGAELDPARLPPAATGQADYDRDIRPIFQSACFRCHGPERPKSHFRLDNQASALKGGDNGIAIVPGQSAKSPLVFYVARLVDGMEMPPAGKGEPLTSLQVGLLRTWIDQGANYPASATNVPLVRVFSLSPLVRGVSVSGNARVFREHAWMPDGISGGLDGFDWQEPLGAGARISSQGRFLSGGQEYRLKLGIEKDELGFVRTGFEQFRKWYNDQGGYFSGFGAPPLAAGRDLYLDVGKAWVEVGLTAPRYPRVTLGYEYQYREGAKSTLQGGLVWDPNSGSTRGVYPATKDLTERTHIIKVDLSHTLAGVFVEDSFRGEFYDSRTRRQNSDFYQLGAIAPLSVSVFNENYRHFQGANTLRLERSINEWLFLSGGYLYSSLDGQGMFGWSSFVPPDLVHPTTIQEVDQQIVIDRESHVFNANALLGPWGDLALTCGFQSEWTRQHGFTAGLTRVYPRATGDPGGLSSFSRLDRFETQEDFTLRYTGIPHAVLFADSRFHQGRLGQFETGLLDNDTPDERDFLRNTRATEDFRELGGGFVISPWRQVSWQTEFKQRNRLTEYNHANDWDASVPPTLPGEGYPAFIRSREIRANEVQTKLVLHPAPWLKTTFKYQNVFTEYTTATDTVDDGNGGRVGGQLVAGTYRAHVPSFNVLFVPWHRLSLSSTFSYARSRIQTAFNDDALVVPYRGDTYSVLSSATFKLTRQADVQASYSFSKAQYTQHNEALALPLGIAYDRHGVMAGVTRRFKKNLTTSLQYGFFKYNEPTAGGARDYTAHAIFGSVALSLP